MIAQTLRPTAAAMEQGAEVTAKWAKRVEKEYMAVNTVASSYFSLLAVCSPIVDSRVALIGS